MSAPASSRTLAVLFAGVLLGALDIAIVGPALPAIQKDLGVDAGGLSWVFNIYILFSLIGAALLAKLSDRYGRRAVYTACLGVFGAGSALVAAAPELDWLLAGRAVQAVGAGGLLPVASAVVADTFPVERRGRALGLIGAVFGLAFVLGPIVGGLLLPYGWRWLFIVNLPLVAALIPAAFRMLPPGQRAARGALDWRGATSLAVVLAALASGIGAADSGAPAAGPFGVRSLALFGLAALGALAFWRFETRADDPVFHPSLLRSRQMRVIGAIAASTGLVEAGMVFLPALSVQAFGVSPSTASFMLLPLVAALIVGSLAAGRLLDGIGAKPVIQAGITLTAAGLMLLAALPTALWSFYAAGTCIGLGLAGLLGAPLRFVAMQEAGASRRGASQGLLTLFLSLGRMVGAALVGSVAGAAASEIGGYRRAFLYLGIVAVAAVAISAALRSERARAVREGAEG